MTIEWAGEELVACPERALFWPSQRTLFVADLHLGKTDHLDRLGIQLPGPVYTREVEILEQLAERLSARRVIFLGDTLDTNRPAPSLGLTAFRAWKDRQARYLDLFFVPGNHDGRAGDLLGELGLRPWPQHTILGPFLLSHEPVESGRGYVLSGHLHPGAVLTGKGRASLRLPCFHFQKRCAVLPAFGRLTGLAPVRPRPGDRVLVVADGEVLEVRLAKSEQARC